MLPQYFEGLMMLCFGISWPASIIKTVQVKNPAGKSFIFLWLVLIGYTAGAVYKLLDGIDMVFPLYVLNGTMVLIDLVLSTYYRARNARLAKKL